MPIRTPLTAVGYRDRRGTSCLGMHGTCAPKQRLEIAHLVVPVVLRLVAAISQESLPCISLHA